MRLLLKIKNIIVLSVILISLSGCIKDYDLNPYTTVLNQLIKEKKQNGYKIKTER